MMLQEQLGKAQAPFANLPSLQATGDGGLLGNTIGQAPAGLLIADITVDVYRRQFGGPLAPGFKLALLKFRKFTPEGREQRIALSLAALNAPQPTDLTVAAWKEVLAEAESDED